LPQALRRKKALAVAAPEKPLGKAATMEP